MDLSDSIYNDICIRIWDLYKRCSPALPTRSHARNRNLLFPPPPRNRHITLLFVGISPNNNAGIAYNPTFEGTRQFARNFEYVSGGPSRDRKLSYDAYYGELLRLAKKIDKRFEVWWQTYEESNLLVEFTDALHLATERGQVDITSLMSPKDPNCPIREECKQILALELKLYKPKIVIGNGRLPSDLLQEICTEAPIPASTTLSHLTHPQFACNVHLSGFLTSQSMDGFSRVRLINEIKQLWTQ